MGALVFAGSAQIVAVERMVAGAGIFTAFIAGFALNLRLVLITASIREFFQQRPLWQRVIGAHLSSDENWALTLSRRSQGEDAGYWFLVGSGMTIFATWLIAGICGVIFSSYIPEPEKYAFDFAFTAAFYRHFTVSVARQAGLAAMDRCGCRSACFHASGMV